MNNNIAPNYLPQISAPYEYILSQLNNEDVEYNITFINPNELNPIQPFVFSDNIKDNKFDNKKPIWISKNNDILDGHHRWISTLMGNQPIKCICIYLDTHSAIRILNKIQDIYDYDQQKNMEEVVTQDAINIYNNKDTGISNNEFLATLEEMETPENNKCKMVAYRDKPIMENSAVGNFFILEPIDGYDKYEIDFENLLDTDTINIQFDDHEHPIDALAKNWFPNINFDELSKPYKYTPQELKNKAIVDRAQKMGYDGIKYGNFMIQGLK